MYLISCLPQLVYQKDRHEIEYYDKFSTLQLSWYGHVNSDMYMHMLDEMLKLAIEYQTKNWLIDARDVDFMELGESSWTYEYFRKKVLNCPLRKVARLASGNFENETYISSFISSVLKGQDLPYQFSYCPDSNAAFEWFTKNNS
ncbi:hypothetical protein I5M27_08915 [Adhaeribacter sp. BT258]|uniref:STAS/SEC14 domain-containing protein n=1 Tax=Adhaeribacter terrigena TaxID=2793070 RepID=A0ABS1C199_9BACT|nr:hypothetical protein [Adhaeribacter terrigena]MBK0403103.1 hypothetical protein [Adhaeribacter terrigena]